MSPETSQHTTDEPITEDDITDLLDHILDFGEDDEWEIDASSTNHGEYAEIVVRLERRP